MAAPQSPTVASWERDLIEWATVEELHMAATTRDDRATADREEWPEMIQKLPDPLATANQRIAELGSRGQ